MTVLFEAVTPYVVDAAVGGVRWPRLDLDHPLRKWEDVTAVAGTNPDAPRPNPDCLSIVGECDQATFAAIQADANYAGCILWREDIADPAG